MNDWIVKYFFENRGSIIVNVKADSEGGARTLAHQEARKHFDQETLDAATDVTAKRKGEAAPEGSLGDVLGRALNEIAEKGEEAVHALERSDHSDHHLAAHLKQVVESAREALKRIERI